MEKIPTIFDRDWIGGRKVLNKPMLVIPDSAVATEKIDGTNVRLTARNHLLMRVEKRCNPTPVQKAKGVVDPWYIDADDFGSSDKYIFEAARNTNLSAIDDGEWSGEAIGEKIQGNPTQRDGHTVVLFSNPVVRFKLIVKDVPTSFEELRVWLPKQKSVLNPMVGIEGIVWWLDGEPIGKIKLKDF